MAFSKEDLDQMFDGMSPEDLEALKKELMGEEKKDEPPPAPQVIDHDKLAASVASKITPPPAPQQEQQIREAFDMKRFQERFLSNPVDGLGYAYEAQLGFNPLNVIPVLAAALTQQKQEMEQLKARTFRKEAGLDDDSWQKVEQFRQAKGLNDWDDAWELAKARGIIQASKPEATPVTAPPRLPRGGGGQSDAQTEAALMASINELSDDKLEELFMRGGGITSRHLTR